MFRGGITFFSRVREGLFLSALALFLSLPAQAEVPLRISDELSTIVAQNLHDRISIRAAGTVTEDGEVVLKIIADMPESRSNNQTVTTPAAAIGNTQLDCLVEDNGRRPDTRVFTCDSGPVSRGLQNRVCVGYEEAFQFGFQEDLTVYADNRCIDFFGL